MKKPRYRLLRSCGLTICASVMVSCASMQPVPAPISTPAPAATPTPRVVDVVKGAEFVVVKANKGDSLASLAKTHLGGADKAWVIGDFNGVEQVTPGQEIVIPLKPQNPVGVTADGYQTVPILCYHRFGDNFGKLSVSSEKFRQQLTFLRDNGYRVVPLSDLTGFLQGKTALPRHAVVITIDDGYRSTFEIAYPLLKEFGFPATVFLYSDFMGGRDAVSWQQVEEMSKDPLIDLQPHSKSHPNMALKLEKETDAAYASRIALEVNEPSKRIEKVTRRPIHTFAYPYGDTGDLVISTLAAEKFNLGVTVQPGTNAAFAYPYMLRRTMVFGDFDEQQFKRTLVTFEPLTTK